MRQRVKQPLLVPFMRALNFPAAGVARFGVIVVLAYVIGADSTVVVRVSLAVRHHIGLERHALVTRLDGAQQKLVIAFLIAFRHRPVNLVGFHLGHAQPVTISLHSFVCRTIRRQCRLNTRQEPAPGITFNLVRIHMVDKPMTVHIQPTLNTR